MSRPARSRGEGNFYAIVLHIAASRDNEHRFGDFIERKVFDPRGKG
jgi:hypothetical protein